MKEHIADAVQNMCQFGRLMVTKESANREVLISLFDTIEALALAAKPLRRAPRAPRAGEPDPSKEVHREHKSKSVA